MIYRKIDNTGLFIEDVIFDTPPMLDDQPDPSYIATPVPEGFYWPKWDGTQWVEGRTDEEIAAIKAGVVTEPTLEERVGAVETTTGEIVTALADIMEVTI